MTPERAKEVIRRQAEFPMWGSYRKFMTPQEQDFVDELFYKVDGDPSFASLVQRIATGEFQAVEA